MRSDGAAYEVAWILTNRIDSLELVSQNARPRYLMNFSLICYQIDLHLDSVSKTVRLAVIGAYQVASHLVLDGVKLVRESVHQAALPGHESGVRRP